MNLPLALRVLVTAALALPAASQQLLQTHTGSTGWEYGHAVLPTSDQNGDGYPDVLVGAPGANAGRGSIRCLSGRFIATATGAVELWSLAPSITTGARFGTAIIEVASLVGDSAADYVVGAPGVSSNHGTIYVVDGTLHQIVASKTIVVSGPYRFGETLAAMGDLNGDGAIDLAVGAPGDVSPSSSVVFVLSGSDVASSALFPSGSIAGIAGTRGLGSSLASGFDLNGDGQFDLAIGSPNQTAGNMAEAGAVHVWLGGSSFVSYLGSQASEHLGASVDAAHDYNGDGVVDLIVGAPDFLAGFNMQAGRAVVLSGQKLLSATAPIELFNLSSGSSLGVHFGACVRASADLNNDGTADVIVGMPAYFSPPFGLGKGGAIAFSGRTGMRIGSLLGLTHDNLGDALLGGFLDLNGDGFLDFGVAGSLSDNPSVDGGMLEFYSLFPSPAGTYCTSKVNSLGCTPTIAGFGTASVSSASPFTVNCSNVINQRSGLMMYSHQPIAAAFQGGYLCVNTPLRRTPQQNSGGSATGSDCTGAFNFDFNAQIDSGLDPTLVAGAEVFAQYWSRDPLSPSFTNLSNALRFLINP